MMEISREASSIPNGVSPPRQEPFASKQSAPGQTLKPGTRAPAGPHAVNVGESERLGSAIAGGALLLLGLSRRTLPGLLLALGGGGLIYRGLSGQCSLYKTLGVSTAQSKELTRHVEKSVTIDRPLDEVYRFWRDLENLPRFMKHVLSVKAQGKDSHWVVKGPAGTTVEWDAEITDDRENEYLAWRSLDGAKIPNEGMVRVRPAPGGRGTEVHVLLRYTAPAGKPGVLLAKLLGEEPELQTEEDLHRVKQLLETGEIPTTQGQSSGRS